MENQVRGFDIRQVYVARRPMRHGGLRLEKESLQALNSDGTNVSLIHCYGAGASGYKISWGVARRVADLVAESMTGRSDGGEPGALEQGTLNPT